MKDEIKLRVGQRCKMLFEKNEIPKDKIVTIVSIRDCDWSSCNKDLICCQQCRKRIILKEAKHGYDCWGNTSLGFSLKPIDTNLRDIMED